MSLQYRNQSQDTLRIQLMLSSNNNYNDLQPETTRHLIDEIIKIIASSENYNEFDQAADALIGGNKPSENFLREAFKQAAFAIGREEPINGWGGGRQR